MSNCSGRLPFLAGYPGLPQYAREELDTDLASMRIGKAYGRGPADHELMLPAGERAIEPETHETADQCPAARETERGHQTTRLIFSSIPPARGRSRF